MMKKALTGFSLIVLISVTASCMDYDSFVYKTKGYLRIKPEAKVVEEVVCGDKTADLRKLPLHESGVRVARNISYKQVKRGDGKYNTFDVYGPDAGVCLPIVVFVHGGGWIGGDKRYVGSKPEAFVSKGFLFVSVNYRLSPAVQFPEHVRDVAAAVAGVKKIARDYGGNPDEIFVIGHSAGAYLSAIMATDDRYLKEVGLELRDLTGVVLLDGVGYDMPLQMTMTGGPDFDRVYQMAFGVNPRTWNEASPLNYIKPGKSIPPFLVFHLGPGQATGVQAGILQSALKDAGIKVESVYARGKSHARLNSELGIPGDEPTRQTFDFISELRR